MDQRRADSGALLIFVFRFLILGLAWLMRSHQWIDQRSLALDRLIAQKLLAKPALLERARYPHPLD
jgi:hypothetical protein